MKAGSNSLSSSSTSSFFIEYSCLNFGFELDCLLLDALFVGPVLGGGAVPNELLVKFFFISVKSLWACVYLDIVYDFIVLFFLFTIYFVIFTSAACFDSVQPARPFSWTLCTSDTPR